MPALVADIGVAIRDAAIETWSDPAILARYPSARDGSTAPAEGFFDSATDAATVLAARAALIGTERRRFTVTTAGVLWIDPAAGMPTIALADAEQAASQAMLVARLQLDLETEATGMDAFG